MGEKEYENLADEPAHLHFDFWLNDIEGETLFGCIQHEIVDCHKELMLMAGGEKPDNYPPGPVEAYRDWYEERIKFLDKIKEKLHNTREEKGPNE